MRHRHPASASRPEARSVSAGRAQPGASRSSQGIRQDRRSQVPSLDTPADAALQRSTRRLGANQSRAPTQGRAPRAHRSGVRIHSSHFEQIARWKIRPAARGRDRGMGSGTCGSSSWLLNPATAGRLGRKKWSHRLTPGEACRSRTEESREAASGGDTTCQRSDRSEVASQLETTGSGRRAPRDRWRLPSLHVASPRRDRSHAP